MCAIDDELGAANARARAYGHVLHDLDQYQQRIVGVVRRCLSEGPAQLSGSFAHRGPGTIALAPGAASRATVF